jgi:transposase
MREKGEEIHFTEAQQIVKIELGKEFDVNHSPRHHRRQLTEIGMIE